MLRTTFVAVVGVATMAGCAPGSFGESAASGLVQGALSGIGLAGSGAGNIVQATNRAAYNARTGDESENMPRPQIRMDAATSATQDALNRTYVGKPHIQVDTPDGKTLSQSGVVTPAVAASDTISTVSGANATQ